MTQLKFELVIAYYKRPTIVLNALESIKNLDYDNWHLTFIDDSGDTSFKNTLFEFGLDNNKVTYEPILMSDNDKVKIGGSIFGKYVNDAIKKNECDVVLLICDDDALLPDYLTNLNKFYNENPDKMWGYCHLKYFDPDTQHYSESSENFNSPLGIPNLNRYTHPIKPSCVVDSSQVSFRKQAFVDSDVWYPYPHTADLDAHLFHNMSVFWGVCHFTNCIGQYKGWFADQLGKRMRKDSKMYID